MEDIGVIFFAVIWIGTMLSMIVFRNKCLVIERNNGLKIYIEDIDYEEDDDVEMQ